MKKITLLVSLLGSFLFGAQAQESGLEIKGGASLGFQKTSVGDVSVSGNIAGFHLRGLYTHLLSESARQVLRQV